MRLKKFKLGKKISRLFIWKISNNNLPNHINISPQAILLKIKKKVFLNWIWITNVFLLSQFIIEKDLITCHFNIIIDLNSLYPLYELLMQDNPPSFFKNIEKSSGDKQIYKSTWLCFY